MPPFSFIQRLRATLTGQPGLKAHAHTLFLVLVWGIHETLRTLHFAVLPLYTASPLALRRARSFWIAAATTAGVAVLTIGLRPPMPGGANAADLIVPTTANPIPSQSTPTLAASEIKLQESLAADVLLDPQTDLVLMAHVPRLWNEFPSLSRQVVTEPIAKSKDQTSTRGSVSLVARLSVSPRPSNDSGIIRVSVQGDASSRTTTSSGKIDVDLKGTASFSGNTDIVLKLTDPPSLTAVHHPYYGTACLQTSCIRITKRSIAPGLLRCFASRVVSKELPKESRGFRDELIDGLQDKFSDGIAKVNRGGLQEGFQQLREAIGITPVAVGSSDKFFMLQAKCSGKSAASQTVTKSFQLGDDPNTMLTAFLNGNALFQLSFPVTESSFSEDNQISDVPLYEALTHLKIIAPKIGDSLYDGIRLGAQESAISADLSNMEALMQGNKLSIRIPVRERKKTWGSIAIDYTLELSQDGRAIIAKPLTAISMTAQAGSNQDIETDFSTLTEQLVKATAATVRFPLADRFDQMLDELSPEIEDYTQRIPRVQSPLVIGSAGHWIAAHFAWSD